MQICNSLMHPVTMGAIVIELVILGALTVFYLLRIHNREQLGYIVLNLLLIGFNTVNGLLPNPIYAIPVYIQHMIVNMVGFVIVCLFPWYFYKNFAMERLRFLAIYGVPLFMVFPYICFFVVGLPIHQDIALTHKYGYIVPTAYSLTTLVTIGRGILDTYHKLPNHIINRSTEMLVAYIAIVPWAFLAPVVYFGWGQLMETLFTNVGFVALNVLLLYRSVSLGRADQRQLENLRLLIMDTEVIANNCKRNMLSPRETEIAILLCHRLTRREISEKLFISDRTVEKHTEHIFLKAGVKSRQELLLKLNTPL